MARTAHKKSRRGCATCKARHVKCDETRPSCINCSTVRRRCAYLEGQNSVASQNLSSAVTLPAGITSDLVHVSALNQWCRHTHEIYFAVDNQHHPGTIMLDIAIQHTFLLHGLLAISCFHLGITDPVLHDAYIGHSYRLLAHGMEGFNTIGAGVRGFDESNIMAGFVFANVAGLCKFAHLFSTMHESVEKFMEHLIDTLTVLRGVNIVLGPWWSFITGSALFKAVTPTDASRKGKDVNVTETADLSKAREVLADAKFETERRQVCQQVINQLQAMYNELSRKGRDDDASKFPESIWFFQIPTEFHALLSAKNPEALVILAHITPLLHNRRQYWLVRNAGEVLLNGISDYLGLRWSPYLEELHRVFQTSTET